MKEKSDSQVSRKSYTKPELRRVPLTPEEALAAGCKSFGGAGPLNPCENSGQCFTIGS
jgi:hypothetical protein